MCILQALALLNSPPRETFANPLDVSSQQCRPRSWIAQESAVRAKQHRNSYLFCVVSTTVNNVEPMKNVDVEPHFPLKKLIPVYRTVKSAST